ncbi:MULTISPECIES: sulfurtransferase [Hyphobacterium]|uniref:Sulfurtransferase n=1 Tax=Hyphobacterium vulgare TaxID=1736751 RepID=A0ABV6ZTB0_9PROT
MTDPLVAAEEALDRHGDGRTVFIDATWTFPAGPQPAHDGYIPGAVPLDIDTVKDTGNPLPHMLPSTGVFAAHMDALGITNDTPVIVYDWIGLFSAPRVWWMFKVMGHDDIRVLDGGLHAWLAAGGPVTDEPGVATPSSGYVATFRPERVADRIAVLAASQSDSANIIDARPRARFEGASPEPREGMRSGHIPGAICHAFLDLWTPERAMRRDRKVSQTPGFEPGKPVITTCGSGVTASLLALALEREGIIAAVYDGSWAEWGSRPDTPVETGPQRKGGA